MKKQTVVVSNRTGVHGRPSALIARTAKLFNSSVTIHARDQAANASSMIEVMTLEMRAGEFVDIVAEGPDELLAVEAVARLFADEFGEWSLYD